MSKYIWNSLIKSYLILTEAETLFFPPLPQGRDRSHSRLEYSLILSPESYPGKDRIGLDEALA